MTCYVTKKKVPWLPVVQGVNHSLLAFTWILRFRPLFPEKWKAKQQFISRFLYFLRLWYVCIHPLLVTELKNMCTVNPFRELLNFLFSKVYCFSSCHERETKRKFWVPMRNRTSDLHIPRSDALPLSHRDSTMSEVYYEVHITRVLHTARISREGKVFELGKELEKDLAFVPCSGQDEKYISQFLYWPQNLTSLILHTVDILGSITRLFTYRNNKLFVSTCGV